ncbi:MAG: hypothetical protein ACI9T8_000448 [Candidatus Saccharimonadales bacterium]|jgi:hypothetical protein
MSRLIANLLDADPRTLDKIVSRLEHMSIQPGIDVQLTAEIITQTREKARRLGLDPADTTPKEFYYALVAKARADGEVLRYRLGLQDPITSAKAAEIIASSSEALLKRDIVVSMQPAAVKRILKAVPPKKTMRALHFRSVDSVLKRENPLLVYSLAKRLEDKTWHSQVHARIKRLQARDAVERPVQILSLSEAWLEKLKKHDFDSVVQPVPEIGSVLILPSMPLAVKGSVLLTVSLVLQAAQRLAIESLPYRAKALSTGLENLLPDIAAGVLDELAPVHGMQPSWNAVYQLLSQQSKSHLPDFEFVLSDLEWESTETRLASLAPELDFWVNTHFLGFKDSPLPLSLHVVDVAASLVMDKKYSHQVVSHMRSSLWNELQVRYMKHESMEQLITSQLTMAQGIIL